MVAQAPYLALCCRNMSGELAEQVRIIEKMVSLDFTKYVTEDINRPLDDARPLLEEVRSLSFELFVINTHSVAPEQLLISNQTL